MSSVPITSEFFGLGGTGGVPPPNPPNPNQPPVILCLSSTSSPSDSRSETELENEENLPKKFKSVFAPFYRAVGVKVGVI